MMKLYELKTRALGTFYVVAQSADAAINKVYTTISKITEREKVFHDSDNYHSKEVITINVIANVPCIVDGTLRLDIRTADNSTFIPDYEILEYTTPPRTILE